MRLDGEFESVIPADLRVLFEQYVISLDIYPVEGGQLLDIYPVEGGQFYPANTVWLVESQDPDQLLFFIAASLDAAWAELRRRADELECLTLESIKLDEWPVAE